MFSLDPYGSTIKRTKLTIDFYDHLLSAPDSQTLYDIIESTVRWSKPLTANRRSNQTYGDSGLVYEIEFGGYGRPRIVVRREAIPWDTFPMLCDLRDAISDITRETYNFCVIQRYPSGRVGINPHRDKEMIMGTTICGLSLGATRTLTMVPPKMVTDDQVKLKLPPGSMYVLRPPTNSYWQHSIDKDDTTTPRISLTFRTVS